MPDPTLQTQYDTVIGQINALVYLFADYAAYILMGHPRIVGGLIPEPDEVREGLAQLATLTADEQALHALLEDRNERGTRHAEC
jgi:hypothetical protein